MPVDDKSPERLTRLTISLTVSCPRRYARKSVTAPISCMSCLLISLRLRISKTEACIRRFSEIRASRASGTDFRCSLRYVQRSHASKEARHTSGLAIASFPPKFVLWPKVERDPHVCYRGILLFLEEQHVFPGLVLEPAPGGLTGRRGAVMHQQKLCNVLPSTLSWTIRN